mmetsp:Transcript_117033/g.303465  ORF Transcript_117033/g.303465 Transcript_117033/m.303465 type:complete len:555 (-) Transcript_117033:27-1691(-)
MRHSSHNWLAIALLLGFLAGDLLGYAAASLKTHHKSQEWLPEEAVKLPEDIAAPGWEQWVFCADEHMQCQCPGEVRWGTTGHWTNLGHHEKPIVCSAELGDPCPGKAGRGSCECAIVRGSDAWFRMSPAVLPEQDTSSPVVFCGQLEASKEESAWSASLWEAVAGLCGAASPPELDQEEKKDKSKSDKAEDEAGSGESKFGEPGPLAYPIDTLQDLMQAWVDPRFRKNYERAYRTDGWVERAFVNYVGNCVSGGKYDRMMQQLIRSVHLFSSKPIVVVHYGMVPPPSWDPVLFPRLVLLHAKPLPQDLRWRSFNYNKYRAILLARVHTGIQLDSDQFVAPGVDALFDRTAAEINREYPMPILPVHFLPNKGPSSGGVWWPRFCQEDGSCPLQTMRWAHAHPTFTYFALPFLGKWLRRNLRDEVLPHRKGYPDSKLRVLDVPEDEDLLNLGLWEDNATKQWCKWETPDPSDLKILLEGRLDGGIVGDKRFYPEGSPLVFYTAHHAVDPEASAKLIDELEEKHKNGDLLPPITYKGKFYHNHTDLLKDHPKLPCII